MIDNQNWNEAVHQLSAGNQPYVLVTVLGALGSTPRDSGTKMVISQAQCFDTIGGGHLEHKVIAFAQKLLAIRQVSSVQHIEHFQLAANLGQCCGGSTSVLFEYFPQTGVNVMLFGAGHVGRALVSILSSLPCQVKWVDSREHEFPEQFKTNHHGNIKPVLTEFEADEINDMPSNSYYIVMTHNHQLDFELCKTILLRQDFNYLGLIASDTKWRRFQQRFKHHNIDDALVSKMDCPIGLEQVSGKKPMEVAVSVAAQIISKYQSQEPTKPSKQGVQWSQLKQLITES